MSTRGAAPETADSPTSPQILIDWLQGVADPDGQHGVDPYATNVRVALREPSGHACLWIETMAGETLLLALDPEPLVIADE